MKKTAASPTPATEYHVSAAAGPGGSGTLQHPFGTLAQALLALRQGGNAAAGACLWLHDGNHLLPDTLCITAEDAPPGGAGLTICARPGTRPVLSGGLEIDSWEPCTLNGLEMLRAALPRAEFVRDLFVDGHRRHLASLFQQPEQRVPWGWIPHTDRLSFELRGGSMGHLARPQQLEVVWHPEWKTIIYRAESVASHNIINMRAPDFYEIAHTVQLAAATDFDPNGYWFPNPARHPLYLQNDPSFLRQPGQFCFDETEGMLYYLPLPGEDMARCRAVVPVLDQLVAIDGRVEAPAENICFKGVTFAYSALSLIAREGFGVNQAQCIYDGPATYNDGVFEIPYKQVDGCVVANHVCGLHFENCVVIHTTGPGLSLRNGVKDAIVTGCVFNDVGDSGLVIGDAKTPYAGPEERTQNILVKNCLFRRLGRVNKSAPALQAYYVQGLILCHNDVYDTPYSGIAVGWGWHRHQDSDYARDNVIEYNRVGNFNNVLRDGGGIYTLGQQPGSHCRFNYIFEEMEAYGGLYHDEGTAYYTTTHNVVDNNTRLHDPGQSWLNLNGRPGLGPGGISSVHSLHIAHNFTSNRRINPNADMNSTHIVNTVYVDNGQWPAQAIEIMDQAGLEPAFRHLLAQYG